MSKTTSQASAKTKKNFSAIILYCAISLFLFSLVSLRMITRPMLLTYGQETQGVILEKKQSLGFKPVSELLLLVNFKGVDGFYSYYYPVPLAAYNKAKSGSSVTIRYFQVFPFLFTLKEYKTYNKTSTLLATALLIVLLFIVMVLFFKNYFHRFLDFIEEQTVIQQCLFALIGVAIIITVFHFIEQMLVQT